MAPNAAAISRGDVRAFQLGYRTKRKPISFHVLYEKVLSFVSDLLKFIGISMLLFASMLAGNKAYTYVFQTDYFSVDEVVVTGLVTLKEEDLKSYFNVQAGNNTFRLDLQEISKNLMANSWLETVSVRRELPNRLIIDVTERKPFAKILAHGKVFLVDMKGSIISEVKKQNYKSLPIIGGLSIEKPDKESKESLVVPGIFMTALKLLKFVQKTNLLQEPIAGIRIDNRYEMAMITQGRRMEVRVDTQHLTNGLSRLGAIFDYANMEGKTIKSIDLFYRNKAVVKFVEDN